MAFESADNTSSIKASVSKICAKFGYEYWRKKDQSGEFPHEFYARIAEAGFLGIAMPEKYGGSGLGLRDAVVLMQTIAESGAGMSGSSAVHINIFGLQPVVVFGTDEQKSRMLPPLISGHEKACFAVTEPDAGLNLSDLKVKAIRDGDRYLISGQKIWTSTAQVADRVLLLARTTPVEECKSKYDGLSLFYAPLDRNNVEIRGIRKMGRHAVDSNSLFFDRMEVPVEDRIGEEGAGFRSILHGLNPERILIAAEAIGIGRAALELARKYGKERVVFGHPIARNQSIQHPLAKSWMELEAAGLMVSKAAALYDAGAECGAEANAAKFLAAEAGFRACENAVLTLGGMGYAAEYDVERLMREIFIPRLAPVSQQMILNYISEKVLDLPRSY